MQFMHTLFVYDEELRGAYRAIHFVYLTMTLTFIHKLNLGVNMSYNMIHALNYVLLSVGELSCR